MNSPIIPGQRARGMKAASVVAVDVIMGMATSAAPSFAAWTGVYPWLRNLYMFSTVTIPLSTSIPNAKTKANRTMKFRVTPIEFSMKKLKSILKGIAIPTNKAFLKPKKKVKTRTTSKTPKMMEFSNSLT